MRPRPAPFLSLAELPARERQKWTEQVGEEGCVFVYGRLYVEADERERRWYYGQTQSGRLMLCWFGSWEPCNPDVSIEDVMP